MGKGRLKPEALTLQQTADILDVCPATIRRWIAKGYVKAYRVGPVLIRVPISEVARLRQLRVEAAIEEERPKFPIV